MSIYLWIGIFILILLIIVAVYFLLLNYNRDVLLYIIDNQLNNAKNLSTENFNNYIKDYLAVSKAHPEFFGTGKDINYQRKWATETLDLFKLNSIVEDFRKLNSKYGIKML